MCRARSGRGVEQACVVTLDPVENEIDESIAAVFAPPSQIPVSPKFTPEGKRGRKPRSLIRPEPIVNGTIDLGTTGDRISDFGN